VLNNYDRRCAVTGLAVSELLIASHILPWARSKNERLNLSNSIALSRLHGTTFNRGLVTFDAQLRLMLSTRLKGHLPQKTVAECFAA